MMKKKTFSCIIFENGFEILSFNGKVIGRTRENSSFYRSVPLTVVVLLDGIFGIDGGGVGGSVSVCVGSCSGGIGGSCWWCL